MIGFRRAALLLLLATLAACGGASSVVANRISIAFAPAIDPPPFDPAGARIQDATADLYAVAGHPITLQFDRQLVTLSGGRFEKALPAAIKALARSLRELQKGRPAVFAREVPRLVRIEVGYEGPPPQSRADVDMRMTNRVVLASPAAELSAGDREDVSDVLEEDFRRAFAPRFDGRTPEQIASGDRADYFDYVRLSGTLAAETKRLEGLPESARDAREPGYLVIVTAARLAAAAGDADPKLAATIRSWLLEKADRLGSYGYAVDPPPGSAMRLARQAIVGWLAANIRRFDAKDRLRAAEIVLSYPNARPGETYYWHFDGFDAHALSLAVVDEWIAAGHPEVAPRDPPGDLRFALMDMVVCPVPHGPNGEALERDHCRPGFVWSALANDAGTRWLADALASRPDAPLFQAAFGFLRAHEDGGTDVARRLSLLRALEPHPRAWQLGARLLIAQRIDHFENGRKVGCDKELGAAADRIWQAAPDLRGTALYLTACVYAHEENQDYRDSALAQLARSHGESVGAIVFGRFLDEGPDAWRLAPILWPALGKGWSRAGAIASKLDVLLNDPRVRAGENGEPTRTLAAIAERLCEDGNAEETAALHAALEARAHTHPADARIVASAIADTGAARRCARRK